MSIEDVLRDNTRRKRENLVRSVVKNVNFLKEFLQELRDAHELPDNVEECFVEYMNAVLDEERLHSMLLRVQLPPVLRAAKISILRFISKRKFNRVCEIRRQHTTKNYQKLSNGEKIRKSHRTC